MKCKLIKDYGFFKEGDILEWDDELNAYTLDVQEDNKFRSAMVDSYTVDYLFEEDYIEMIEEVDPKIEEAVEMIDKLLEQYESDFKETSKKASKGEIQPCVEVEAKTVYYNLTKVLNKIKEILTNEQAG